MNVCLARKDEEWEWGGGGDGGELTVVLIGKYVLRLSL